MIPNLHWMTINLGIITLQVWGLFVGLGIATALFFAKREAEQRGLKGEVIIDMGFWIILASMLGSRVFFVVTEWSLFQNDLLSILKVWDGGMSITGGFIGSAVAAILYLRKKKLSFWRYADIIVMYLPLGLAIGRLGCFFIFDHPGTVTNFFLGEVYYADGLVHHNHGLYLSLNALVMFGVFMFAKRRFKPESPFYSIVFLIWDGMYRLIVDSNRILDSTFNGLTAAQISGGVMVILGIILFGQRQNIRKKYLK